MNRTQAGLLLLLAAGVAVLAALGLEAAGVAGSFSVHQCITGTASGPPKQPAPPPVNLFGLGWAGFVALVCTLGFIGGDVWGHMRARGHARAGTTSGAPSTGLQALLVGLFAFGAFALGYETYAVASVAGNHDLWPITYFVRCADDAVSWPTLVGAVVVSVLVGHWLGYQARVELRD